MKDLFSFDEKEFESNLKKANEKESRRGEKKPRVYYKVTKIKNKEKLLKEYNRPKECVFILPNGLHVHEILISGLGTGIVKISAQKVVNDIKFCDKTFAAKKGK